MSVVIELLKKVNMDPLPTELLVMQGSCCGCACENCPYTPRWEGGSIELDMIWVDWSEENPGKTYEEFQLWLQQKA